MVFLKILLQTFIEPSVGQFRSLNIFISWHLQGSFTSKVKKERDI